MFQELILGNQGSGKTAALVSHCIDWLEQGVAPEQIIIVSGHRRRHRQLFEQQLLSRWRSPLPGLKIVVFPEWGRELISLFAPEHKNLLPLLLHTPETLYLLKRFYAQHGHQYWGAYQAHPRFFDHLLRRHWRCAENAWWGTTLDALSQEREYTPLAAEANAFLHAFEIWLQGLRPSVLSISGQMQTLEQMLQLPALHTYAEGFTHWLIDDLDETRYIEQRLYDALSQFATARVMAANPLGGIERLSGAYPEYVEEVAARPGVRSQMLHSTRPQYAIASAVRERLLHQEALQFSGPDCEVLRYQHPTQMIESLAESVQQALNNGIPGHEIVCVTWQISTLTGRQLSAHFEQRQIPIDLFRGSETLQRQPVVNVLLSLMRLVLWERFQHEPRLPRLSGFDMAQIYRLCANMDAFTLSQWRLKCGDQLEAWGQAMREQATQDQQLAYLQKVVSQARMRYGTPHLADLFALAQELWEKLLANLFTEPEDWQAVQQFLRLLQRHQVLQRSLQDPQADIELLVQLLEEEILEEAATPDLRNGRVKIMTLYRLCELRYESQQQFWFDLSSPAWRQTVNHPLDNALLLSRSWPAEETWSLEAEERFVEARLATMIHKAIQYGHNKPKAWACRYDHLAQPQTFERLVRIFTAS